MILQPLLDAVLVDLGGTVVVEAPPGTPVADLRVELRPGVLDDLRAIAADIRLGAVTNTAVMGEADVRALLVDAEIDGLLEVVVTSVDAGAAKPDPASLELALHRLGIDDPSRVLYVGDQPTDAEAAEAAGMPYADVAGGTIALAISTWVERVAGERFEAARGRVAPVDGNAAADGRRPPGPSHQASRLPRPTRDREHAARRHRRRVAASGARAGRDRRVRRRPRGAGLGRVAVAAGGHRPDGGQLHHRWRGGQRAGPPRRGRRST